MSGLFNANEVYEMAMEMERNGAAFYRNAAERFTDEDQRATLLELAEMEDNHLKTFERMRDNLPEAEKAWADQDSEAVRYIQVFADGKVFDLAAGPEDFMKDYTTMGEILMKAVEKERDSVMFYLGLREMAFDATSKDEVERIIREEMGHITLLNDHLEALGGA